MITSLQNPKVKMVRDLLGDRNVRQEAHSFVIEGVRLAEEALANNWRIQFALWSEQINERGKDLIKIILNQQIPCEEISTSLMTKIADTKTPQGILIVMSQSLLNASPDLTFALVLDGMRDPGNLGTILRSAVAFGAQALILLENSVDPFSPKVLRSGMGAHFRIPILFKNVVEFRDFCKKELKNSLSIYLADIKGNKRCWKADFKKPTALVIGGEVSGASQELTTIADERILIPMPGGSESLNAGISASILLYEAMRQRQQ
jgi:TrmH family RNA methyltransferase